MVDHHLLQLSLQHILHLSASSGNLCEARETLVIVGLRYLIYRPHLIYLNIFFESLSSKVAFMNYKAMKYLGFWVFTLQRILLPFVFVILTK